jgi:hypothetical protein
MRALLDEGFVVEDQCQFTVFPKLVILEGSIVCLDGVTLDVRKEIEVLAGRGMIATVQTRRFRYHAWVRDVHNILRYESAHEHRAYAHKHVYDPFGFGAEVGVIELATEDKVPTLAEVIRELQVWHQENAGRLHDLR